MTDLPLEVPEADAAEQRTPAAGGVGEDPTPLRSDIPEADAAEQATPVLPDDRPDADGLSDLDALIEANPADVLEQSISVRLDDDVDQ
jgi:hypothetical protein